MPDQESKALKDIFDNRRLHDIVSVMSSATSHFDTAAFIEATRPQWTDLSVMQRVRRISEAIHIALPLRYREVVNTLQSATEHLGRGFHTLFLPDYVGRYGLDDFDFSMESLAYFTQYGTSEFGVREYLRSDLQRALKHMTMWSKHSNVDVRRLSSEGTRPRLPWSFRLDAIASDPTLAAPILSNLCEDPNLYVRKSVANHLNDVTKLHPDWVIDYLSGFSPASPQVTWITKQALRTLIKAGDPKALSLIGATETLEVEVTDFSISPQVVSLGDTVSMTASIRSTATATQQLVIDLKVHYVKKSGSASPKVFKWRVFELEAAERLTLARTQVIKDFSTRTHYAGRHVVDLIINGKQVAQASFELRDS